MRYWVYINEKVDGPYEEADLVTLQGFTPETLICSEESASSGGQEWQKASAIFEFDETPAAEPATNLPLLDQSSPVEIADVTRASTADAAALLKKLESLSGEVLNLQAKLDSMQTHLDSALEENKQFAKQAAQTAAQQAVRRVTKSHETEEAATQEKQAAETADKITYPAQADPTEDEIVIRSALDSMYGGNLDEVKNAEQEDAFQELLPEASKKLTDEISDELEFIPVKEDGAKQDLPEVQEAVVTTPSLDEAEKDALINELTASPKEDILDQIIQEHQHEEMSESSSAAGKAGLAAAGLAAAGLAAKLFSKSDESEQKDAAFKIATDKNNPDKLEDVLPAQEMPQDAPAAVSADDPSFLDLPGLEATMHEVSVAEMQEALKQETKEEGQNDAAAQAEPVEQPSEEPAAQPEEPAAQPEEEIVPAQEETAPAEEAAPAQEENSQAEENAAQPEEEIAPIDLSSLAQDAAQAEPVAQPSEETAQAEEPADQPEEETVPVQEENAQAEENAPVQEETVQTEEAQPAEEIAPIDLSSLAQDAAQAEPVAQPSEEPAQAKEIVQAEEIVPVQEEPVQAEEVAKAEEPVAESMSDLPSLDSVSAPLPQTEQTQEEPAVIAELPGLDSVGQPDPAVSEEAQASQTPQWQEDDAIEELVKPQGAEAEALEPQPFTTAPDTAEALLPQEAPQNGPDLSSEESQTQLTGVDLAVPVFPSASAEPVADTPVDNPNDLTEIELNEGSTYLISDFVPPAQLTDDVAAVMNSTKKDEPAEGEKKKSETAFQDMLAATTMQRTTPLSTDGLPEDVAATAVNLENTIQAKRGPSMDIKTVPVVPEPGSEGRLNVNDLNDVNAQHDVKRAGSNSTKMVVMALVGMLVVVILYALLGLMHILPDSVNIFGGKKAAVSQPSEVNAPSAAEVAQEFLPEEEPEAEPAAEAEPTPSELAQTKVQEFPLPNGYLLQGFISSKHPLAASEDIAWTTTDAVEADNYSVIVKVPPENPQSLQTAYRFNYNMNTGILNPTNSDAKNLLDQAYGKVQTSTKKTVAKKGKSKKSANRKK